MEADANRCTNSALAGTWLDSKEKALGPPGRKSGSCARERSLRVAPGEGTRRALPASRRCWAGAPGAGDQQSRRAGRRLCQGPAPAPQLFSQVSTERGRVGGAPPRSERGSRGRAGRVPKAGRRRVSRDGSRGGGGRFEKSGEKHPGRESGSGSPEAAASAPDGPALPRVGRAPEQ